MNFEEALRFIRFSDVTQREGRQSIASIFPLEYSSKHVSLSNAFGIDMIEMGNPASSPQIADQLVEALGRDDLKAEIAAHVRCQFRDLSLALDLGATRLHVYIPYRPHKVDRLDDVIEDALRDLDGITKMYPNLKKIRLSLEHAAALDSCVLVEIYTKMQAAYPELMTGFGITDTTGCAWPEAVEIHTIALNRALPKNCAFHYHLHNDLGLAAATFHRLLALIPELGRPMVFDISVLGLGERNGILSYGDILAILFRGCPTALAERYRLAKYGELLNHTMLYLRTEIGFSRDPLGPLAFSHSAGPHLAGMLEDRRYQQIEPHTFGAEYKMNVGNSGTGWRGLTAWVDATLGATLSTDCAKSLAREVRDLAAEGGHVANDVLLELAKAHAEKKCMCSNGTV